MHMVNVTDAKSHLKEILDWVESGDEVVLTRHGQPIARIESIQKTLKPLPDLAKFRATMPKATVPSLESIRQMRDEGY